MHGVGEHPKSESLEHTYFMDSLVNNLANITYVINSCLQVVNLSLTQEDITVGHFINTTFVINSSLQVLS